MRKHLTTITTIIRHEKDHNRLVFTARLRQRLVVIEEEIDAFVRFLDVRRDIRMQRLLGLLAILP